MAVLALLTELARDGDLAAELCAPGLRGEQGLLTAVKPLLLSGVVAVQLGVVELLDAVQRAAPSLPGYHPIPEAAASVPSDGACLLWQVQRAVPCGATLLCAEDLHAFCLEVSSGNYARSSQGQPDMARGGRATTATATADAAAAAAAASASISQGEMGAEQGEQRVRLGLAVRRLLVPLMAVPQPGAPSVATRLLASLRVRVLPACPRDEARSAAEHAALESACVLALLSWYRHI